MSDDDLHGLELDRDAGVETFAVYLLGFSRGRDEAPLRLAKMFRIDEATARATVASAPSAVKRGATRETALAIVKGLRAIGADVEMRREQGTTSVPPRPPSLPPVASPYRPPSAPVRPAVGVPTAGVGFSATAAVPEHEHREHPGFWASIPRAFVVPFLGAGWLWLLTLAITLIVVSLSQLAPCFGLVMMLLAGAVYLGLLGIYFGQAAQAGLEADETRAKPRWSAPNQHDILYRGGTFVLITLLLFSIPVGLFFNGMSSIGLYVAGLAPYIYWPMALTVSGISGSLASLFNPVDIGKGIVAGGVPYLVLVGFGVIAFAGLGFLPTVAATISPQAMLASVILVAAGVGYIAGVQGYLMGCIVGSRPEKFESIV